MNIKLIALVGCILVLSLVAGHCGGGHYHGHHHGGHNGHHGGHNGHHGGHHGHHGRHHWHRHEPFVNFEVHEPKGLTVSMVQRSPNSTFFGIELLINQDPKNVNETHCDVCQNTTTVTYGKFIVEDEVVVIKKGDVLYYQVLLGDSTNVTRLHPQRLWVTDSIINKCNCETTSEDPHIDVRFGQPTKKPDHRPSFEVTSNPPEDATDLPSEFDEEGNTQLNELYSNENVLFECEVDPATNLCRTAKSEKLTHSDGDLEREVEILEAIVEKMRKSCGSRGTTNLVRLEKFDLDISNTEQVTDYIRSSFSINPEMRQLANRILRVLPESGSPRVVLLDMTSYADKQKVLYHAQTNNLKHISDYDSRRFGRPSRRH
ncbi:uncharacterized protein LOC135717260 [Ochlerotatus camptorhynchus]|uniref:uncharacterized protein LOC135717260 n=1 Tax=Ochlerotatus camptorhynchus TaxID=644619 RepID=UPI0031D27D32